MKIEGFKNKIFKDTFWLGFGEGFSRLLMAVFFIYTTRILGATNFGVFSFALSFVSIFLFFSNFGLSDIITRELAKNEENKKDYPAILSLKLLLSVFAFTIILIGSFFIDPEIRKIIWILGLYVLVNHFFVVVYAFFRAYHKMNQEAWVKIIKSLVILIFGYFFLRYFPSVETLSYILLISNLLIITLVLVVFSFSFSWNLNIWKKTLKVSWPLGLTMAFTAIYIHMDSVMMGFWGQITEVGWYNAAYKLVGILIIGSSLIGASFLPLLSKYFLESRERFNHIFKVYVKWSIVLAISSIILGIVLAPYVIEIVYGPEFSSATLAFQILIVMAGFNFLYIPFYLCLIAINQQKRVFLASLIAAVVNIVFNILLIPSFSLYGAAISTLITYVFLFVLGVISYKRAINQ